MFLATSTSVERVFSQGRQLLSYTRNRMTGKTVRALLCFGDWCRKDIVSMVDIVEAVRDNKGKRKWSSEEVIEIDDGDAE